MFNYKIVLPHVRGYIKHIITINEFQIIIYKFLEVYGVERIFDSHWTPFIIYEKYLFRDPIQKP